MNVYSGNGGKAPLFLNPLTKEKKFVIFTFLLLCLDARNIRKHPIEGQMNRGDFMDFFFGEEIHFFLYLPGFESRIISAV